MSAQYDTIADQYRLSIASPLRTYVEAYSLQRMAGDVSGKSVLDLACGEGFYTRRFRELGANRVVGVDISPAMIEIAEAQERANPLGLEYVCADVETLDGLGEFDIVVAGYLLHYAPSEQAMSRMCERIFGHLRPGGRFVALNENPAQPSERYAGFAQYGFNKTVEQPRQEGSKITYWMVSGREMFTFHAHYFAADTYERALSGAGFRDIEWRPIELDNAGIAECGADYWREYMENPPVTGLEARV
jgi:SAM-dependent methyltransferase